MTSTRKLLSTPRLPALIPGSLLIVLAAFGMSENRTTSSSCPAADDADSHYHILFPGPGDSFHVGETLEFRFCSGSPETHFLEQASYDLSFDSGATWISVVFREASFGPVNTWLIPDTIRDFFLQREISTPSDETFFRISDYSEPQNDFVVSGPFRIKAAAGTSVLPSLPVGDLGLPRQMHFDILGRSSLSK